VWSGGEGREKGDEMCAVGKKVEGVSVGIRIGFKGGSGVRKSGGRNWFGGGRCGEWRVEF